MDVIKAYSTDSRSRSVTPQIAKESEGLVDYEERRQGLKNPLSVPASTAKQTQSEQQEQQAVSIQQPQSGAMATSKGYQKVLSDAAQYQTQSQFNGITVNPQEYSIITSAMAQSDDPVKTGSKYAQALLYSRNYGIPVSAAYDNLDSLNAALTGRKVEYTPTGLQAVVNSFRVGQLSMDRSDVASRWEAAYRSGNEALANQYDMQLQQIDAEMKALQDNAPRGLGITLLKLAAESTPYTARILLKGATIGAGVALAATGVGALAGVPLAAAGTLGGIGSAFSTASIYTAASFAGSWKAGYDINRSSEYYDFIKAGIDPTAADWAASVGAAVNSGIETFLGEVPLISRAISGKGVSKLTSKVMSRLALNGAWGALATGGVEYLMSSAEEGLEEVLQEFTDSAAEAAAYELSDKIAPEKSIPVLKRALQAGLEGFGAALVMGGLPAAVNAKVSVQDAKYLNQEAMMTPSREAFVKNHMEDASLSGMEEAERKDALSGVWEKQQAKASAQESPETKAELAAIDIDEVDQPDEVYAKDEKGNEIQPNASKQNAVKRGIARLEDGRLRTQESKNVTVNSDGSETHTLKLGSAGDTRRYGNIKYTIGDGSTITIDQVQTRPGYEEIVADGIKELGRRYEGYDLKWDPETSSQQAVKAQLLKDNPRGEGKGLNWYDSVTDTDAAIQLAAAVRNRFHNLNKDESTVAAQLMQLAAKSQGKKVSQWLVDNVSSFENKDLGAGKKGGIEFKETEKGIKATIYAAENADFSTFAHETFHLIRHTAGNSKELATALQEASRTADFAKYIEEHNSIIHMSSAEAIEAVQSFSEDGKWTVPQEELAATMFESYLKDDSTASPQLKNLFQKIADWFGRIYQKIRSTVKMDDRVVKAFDNLLAGNPELAKTIQNQNQESTETILNQTDDSPESQYEAIESRYKGTDQWLMAPNGKPTNLTERQWVQVRTPNFIKWFGDWINDPLHASEVVDDNGEPLPVFHRTSADFDTFDRSQLGHYTFGNANDMESAATSAVGFWFNSKKNILKYHDRTIEAFLNIRSSWHPGTLTEGLEVELASLAEDEEIETPKALGERYALRLENRNYDGLILADDELGGTSFVALYPNQIKSATGNSGEFSADNDSILYQTQDKNDALISELNSLGSAKLASERLSELGYNIPDSEMHYEDGKLFIVDDPGLVMETVRKNLKEVSSQLDLFDASAANGAVHYTYFDQSSQDKKRGVLPPDYSYDNGWSGKEPLPQTIKGKWDSFGFVSFIGAKISSSDDVARMFSIYRNPKIEYFHIVTVKDGKINGQYALSSGLANMTIGMLGTAEATIKTIGEDYDKVYLIHNHPSGNITPSNCDIDVTAQYIKNLGSKFDGHIILDHTDYTVLTHSQGSDYISSESVQAKGFHQVASRKVLSDTLRDPNDVANAYLSNSTKENRTVIMLLDGQHRLIEMDDIDISKLNSQYLIDLFKNKQYTAGFVVSDSLNDYDKLKVKVHENNQLPLLDILLVSKDGTINSMVYSGELKSFKWADKYLKGKKKDSFDWSKTSQDETLFQTEDEYQQMVNDAKDFSSPKEFSDFYKTMYDENTDPNLIIKAYDEAHPAPGKPDSGFTASMTDSEKDEELVRQINTDEGLDKFINAIRNLSNFDYQYVQGYLRDMGEDDQIEHEVYQRFEKEASPFIVAIAKGKDKLSDKARKSIRSMIANNARMYRDLYAAILHDDTLKASQYDQFLPDIDEPANEVARLSIMDRKRLSMKIEAEGLKKKILSGEELLEGETEKVIRQLDSDIDSLNERIADLQDQEEKLKKKLNNSEIDYLYEVFEERKAKKQLDRINREMRSRIDSGQRVDPKQVTKQRTIKDKIDLLNSQIEQLHKQNKDERSRKRIQATQDRHDAIDDLKAQMREKEQQRREARKVREYKQNLASSIVTKPSNAVDFEYAQKINAIRQLVDPNFRADHVNFNGKKYSLAEFRDFVNSAENPLELNKYQLDRVTKKSLEEWTVAELEDMAQTVANLRQEGRQIWQAKVDKRQHEADIIQNSIISTLLANPKYRGADDQPAVSSVEARQEKRSFGTRIRSIMLKTLNMDRKAQMLDNGTKGAAFDVLVRQKRDAQSEEYRSITAREQAVIDVMKSTGVTAKDLYELVPITVDGKIQNYSYSDMIYVINAAKETRNYQAVSYGTLVNAQEKSNLNHDDEAIKSLGDARYRQFVSQSEAYLADKPELMTVFNAIEDNLQGQAQRINDVLIREYNEPMQVENYYLPIYRQDFNGTEIAQQIQDDVFNKNAGKSTTAPKSGFKQTRIDISPDHQMPVSYDYFGTWMKSVQQQEHLIASIEYVRKLNRVFKNLGSRDLRSTISATYGDSMLSDIDQYMNEVANPQVFTDVQGLNDGIKFLRGNVYSAYLGYKTSSIVLQAISSPMPYLAEVNPIQLAAGLLKMTAHPAKTWQFITSQSSFMANRSMHPVIDQIKKQAETYTDPKVKRAYSNFLEFGMNGLEAIDRWAVAGGWLAVYDKKLSQMEYQTSPESMKAAAKYADEVVYETQPVGDITELSPLFKSKSEFANAFTQFQTALNVIWQNTVYDVPEAFKQKKFRKAIGLIAGYSLAGILLTAVMDGFDDDDDETDKLRKLIYGSFTQYTDAVPLVGGAVENWAYSLITGDKPYQYQSPLFPAWDKLQSGVLQLTQGNYVKAAEKLMEGSMLTLGLPVSGTKEIMAMFEDGEFHPEALAGQRE